MNSIIIDGKEYTLTPVEPATPTPKNKWRAKYNRTYYFLDSKGYIICDTEYGAESDNFRYLTGNYFKTEEEAQKYKEYLEAVGRVTHRVYELNDGWEADWGNYGQDRFCIYFTNKGNMFNPAYYGLSQYCNVLPYAKGGVYEQIIKEMESDLKIIFNYE